MGVLAVPLMVVGTVLSVAGQISAGNEAAAAGKAQQQAADYQAQELKTQAGQEQAAAQAKAQQTAVNTKYTLSTARAEGAAFGSTSTDPTVVTDEGQIAARGQYNFDSDLYTGNEKAAGLVSQSGLDIYTGQQDVIAGQEKQTASYIGAAGSAASGFGNLAAKYGNPGGPSGGN